MKKIILGLVVSAFMVTFATAFTPVKTGDGMGQGHKFNIKERYVKPKRKKRKNPDYYKYIKAPLIGKYLKKLKLTTKQKKKIYKDVVKVYLKKLKKIKKSNRKIKPLEEAFFDIDKGFSGEKYLEIVHLKSKNIISLEISSVSKVLKILNKKQKRKLDKLIVKKKRVLKKDNSTKPTDANSTQITDSNQTKKDKTK